MPDVDLIYDRQCPNVKQASRQLLGAFAEAGLSPRWREWDRADAQTPARFRGYASPTILVNGEDVAGAEPSDSTSCCRLYAEASGGFQRVPSVELIASALRADRRRLPSESRQGRFVGWPSSLRRALRHMLSFVIGFLVRPCCSIPLLLAVLGVSGAGIAAALAPYRLWFLLMASGFFSVSFYWNFIRSRNRAGMVVWALSVLVAVAILLGPQVWSMFGYARHEFGSSPRVTGTGMFLVAGSFPFSLG